MSNNQIKCWVCLSNHITEINLVNDLKKKQLLCQKCYFVFNNLTIKKEKQIKYYSKMSTSELQDRYDANEFFDTARFIFYIDEVIKKNSKLKKKINHLDIGGGFGFFSKVLQAKYDKINSYNLEPDKNAALVAKKNNKKLNIINLRFEDINKIKNVKFDLVTYWGGVYRTIEPNKVFKYLNKICNQNCEFFFSLPFSFEDMRIQHLKLKDSFDDYLLSDDSNKSLLGSKHMRLFLSKNNFYYKKIIIQNKPFKKKIPIFHFNRMKKSPTNTVDSKKFREDFIRNIKVYNNFFENHLIGIIKNEKKINNIFIFGDNFLSEYALNFLNKKYKKLYLIKNDINDLYKNKNILKLMLNISNFKSNIFIILNNDSKKIIQNSLVNRFHLDDENKIFALKSNFIYKKNVFVFKDKKFLKKKIIIKKI